MIGRRHLLVVVLTVSGAWTSAAAQQPVVASSPEAVSLERRVDSLFSSWIRRDGPGCAVGVYKDGQVVLTRGYGIANVEDGSPITPRTAFHLGSVSKPFTALAVLILEQQGKLSLDDDVRRWVPEMPNYGTPIRVRDLIQHTSGLRDYGPLQKLSGQKVTTMSEFLGLIAAQRGVNFATGMQHEYSHSDYLLLGLIVERVAGVPFGAHLEREVLEPMGMRDSFVDDARGRVMKSRAFGHLVAPAGVRVHFPASHTVGGSNVYASVEDLARWDRNFDDPIVGGAAVIARMLSRPQLPSGATIPYAYGLRLGSYRGLRTVSRGGNSLGTRTEIFRFPDQRFTVATLCNAENLEPWRLGQGVADIYLGSQMLPARRRPEAPAAVAMSSRELARYAGVYRPVEHPWNLLPIEVQDGNLGEVLFDDVRDDTLYTMTPAGEGRFFGIGLTGNIGIYTFRSAARAAPMRLEISWNGGPAEVLERIPDSALWRPSTAALADYPGTWYSEDIDATWKFELRGGKLVLRRRARPEATVWPVQRDEFVRGFGPSVSTLNVRLQFVRDSAGKITHLSVSTLPGEESVRDLRFVRIAPR